MATTKATTLAHTIASTTSSTADLNYAKTLNDTGVTSTEFDKLDGLTATTDELNLVDGSAAGPLSHRNMIINGDMRVNQRGVGAITATDSYPVDRFVSSFGANGSFSLQQVAEAPANFHHSIRWTVTGTDTSLAAGQYAYIRTILEGQDIVHLNWGSSDARTVTLSFYIKSSVTGTFGGAVWNSAFDRSYPFTYTVSGTDWERKSITIPGDTTGTWSTGNGIGVNISPIASAGSTYTASAGSWIADGKVTGTGATNIMNGSSATYHVTGVQLELGSVETPFEQKSYAEELARCQRYFCHSYREGRNLLTDTPADSDGFYLCSWQDGNVTGPQWPVAMRTAPTVEIRGHNSTTAGQCSISGGYSNAVASGITPHKSGYISITDGTQSEWRNVIWIAKAELV